MKIDTNKIREIYGQETCKEIINNIDNITENLALIKQYQIDNYYEVFECYPFLLMNEKSIFQIKLDKLINYLGINYKEKLELDMTLWGEIQ